MGERICGDCMHHADDTCMCTCFISSGFSDVRYRSVRNRYISDKSCDCNCYTHRRNAGSNPATDSLCATCAHMAPVAWKELSRVYRCTAPHLTGHDRHVLQRGVTQCDGFELDPTRALLKLAQE